MNIRIGIIGIFLFSLSFLGVLGADSLEEQVQSNYEILRFETAEYHSVVYEKNGALGVMTQHQ